MKQHIVLFILLLATTQFFAQETIAKFKYEDAEKAYLEKEYQTCVTNLEEAEKLLGKTAPNILHLKILAQHKLFESAPFESYEKLETLRNNCSNYLDNYDIQGLENKYRDIYDIYNALNEFPINREHFDKAVNELNAIENQKKAEKEKIWEANRKIIDSLIPLVVVNGGTFQMGLKDKKSLKWIDRSYFPLFEDAQPQHQVTINTFKIAVFETTNEVWSWVMNNNSKVQKEKDLKQAVSVSWNDAQLFITKLNQLTGRKYRLPTEAEWEFAASGGVKSNGYLFSGSNEKNDVSWNASNASFWETKNPEIKRVGKKAPNELGLYDMTGNVWEWCSDWYDSNYYINSPTDNPKGPQTGNTHVARGGSLQCNYGCYIINRSLGIELAKEGYIGFRLASD